MSFDTEKFIREVEGRRAIWDTCSEEYYDRGEKRRQWCDIATAMCEEQLTQKEFIGFCKNLQYKWKNIRTSYTRELKRRVGTLSGSAAFRRSPYVYFELLQFLKNSEENKRRSKEEPSGAENNYDSGSNQSQTLAPYETKKTEDKMLRQSSTENASTEDRDKNEEFESDKLFLLSLVEDFKNIPKHRKLSTKIEIMDVIQRAQTVPIETDQTDYGLLSQSLLDVAPGPSTPTPYSRHTSQRRAEIKETDFFANE